MDLIDNLLKDIPTEEVKDNRLGNHPDAVLDKAELSVKENTDNPEFPQYSVAATFKLSPDENGQPRTITGYIGLAYPFSEGWQKNVQLAWLHGLKILPFENKNLPVISGATVEDRRSIVEAIVAAVNSRVGEVVGIQVTVGKTGYTNVRPYRGK
jgi:hypothetical protein